MEEWIHKKVFKSVIILYFYYYLIKKILFTPYLGKKIHKFQSRTHISIFFFFNQLQENILYTLILIICPNCKSIVNHFIYPNNVKKILVMQFFTNKEFEMQHIDPCLFEGNETNQS